MHLFVHEDNPARRFTLSEVEGLTLQHTCHADIKARLNSTEWIIPRRSGACRSFPMYLAWEAGCEYIITLDDDCLPGEEGERFLETHLEAFEQDRWFRTASGERVRGIPYGDRGCLPVLLNHGLWTGVPDLDGPTSLYQMRKSTAVILRARREVVPPGMFFPLSAMNVCYHRSAIPAAYNLLMGLESFGLDRFDDIWSGLFLKRIADHLGLYVTNGVPFVEHGKASDPFSNLRKESLGIQLHEHFWHHVAAADLTGTRGIGDCYRRLALWVQEFPVRFPQASPPDNYFRRLGEAMRCWADLFA